MGRRVMVLWVPEDVVLTLLGNWRQASHVCLPYLEQCADYLGNRFALPKDVRIDATTYAWDRRAFGLRLEHESFPEVPDGAPPPDMEYRGVTVQAMPDVDGVAAMEPKPGEIVTISVRNPASAHTMHCVRMHCVREAATELTHRFPDVQFVVMPSEVTMGLGAGDGSGRTAECSPCCTVPRMLSATFADAPAPNIDPDLRNDRTLMAMVETAASPGAQAVNGFAGSKSPETAQREAYDLGKTACLRLLQFLADNGQLQSESRSARYTRPGAALGADWGAAGASGAAPEIGWPVIPLGKAEFAALGAGHPVTVGGCADSAAREVRERMADATASPAAAAPYETAEPFVPGQPLQVKETTEFAGFFKSYDASNDVVICAQYEIVWDAQLKNYRLVDEQPHLLKTYARRSLVACEIPAELDTGLLAAPPAEPPCRCASPTVHEAGCAWKAWKDGQT